LRLERRREGFDRLVSSIFLCMSMEAHTHGGPDHSQFPNGRSPFDLPQLFEEFEFPP